MEHTLRPIVTGTSVLAVTYNGGVMVMADTLGSYGSMARFTSIPRICKINENTLVGGSGEYSDFQHVNNMLYQLVREDYNHDDNAVCSSEEIYNYLETVMYDRRSNMNPLWNSLVVAGFDADSKEPFLGMVDYQGSSYKETMIATGYGAYMAIPLMRRFWRENMTEEEAKALLEDAMRVLVYRDCRTINKFQIAKVSKDGVNISSPYELDTKWDHSRFVNPNLA